MGKTRIKRSEPYECTANYDTVAKEWFYAIHVPDEKDCLKGLYHWFVIFHEEGHAYFGPSCKSYKVNRLIYEYPITISPSDPLLQLMIREIKAWGYSYRCLRLSDNLKKMFFDFALSCLKTYNSRCSSYYTTRMKWEESEKTKNPNYKLFKDSNIFTDEQLKDMLTRQLS